MKQLIIFLSFCFIAFLGIDHQAKAESSFIHNKQEFRGVWVATVASIDIGYHYTEDQYKEDFLNILETLEEYNFNAIIFQVRPTNDAFYPSILNPWSKYLTGIEGKSPGWDPLAWMVEESHKRGIEFHAWLNPYRISLADVGNDYDTKEELLNSLSTNNFARNYPELVLQGEDGRLILNPGEPAVKQFIIDTIEEIITNYDVDAIHFDDYFYPYSGITGNGDYETYKTYKNDTESLADWRRSNVDEVIERISDLIHTYDSENNKAVQFGISPFGVWRNSSSDPRGSNTRANQSYDTQYADTRKWVKEEWVDYIAPQLYWEIGHSLADYEVLAAWWADVVSDTKVNLYTGNAIYKYGLNSAWNKYDQLPKQLVINNFHEEIKGSIFFSYKHLHSLASSALITGRSYIKERMWDTIAIQPTLPLINQSVPGKITNVSTTVGQNDLSFDISWDKVVDSKYYTVYRFEEGKIVDLSNPLNLYKVVTNESHGDFVTFTDNDLAPNSEYSYYISVVSHGVVEGPAELVKFTPTTDQIYEDGEDLNKGLYIIFISASTIIVLSSISITFNKLRRR